MINDTLRRKREGLHKSQKEVAEAIPMTLNGYSFIERGLRAPSTKAWFKIKDVLSLSDAELVTAMKENADSVEAAKKEGKDAGSIYEEREGRK